MICKKITSFVASTIKLIIILLLISETSAEENNLKKFENDPGILAVMYHRFDEFKYPSTNIGMKEFKKHIELVNKFNFEFINAKNFRKEILNIDKKKKILLTIDDAYESFYVNAWPFLKTNEIPFLLFISTEPVGKKGYMSWEQIKEVEKYDFVTIGNHSHSHEYLINYTHEEFKSDINKSTNIFKNELGYNPNLFSYPFGEYSLKQKKFIKEKFKFAFGQQSGVIDLNKDFYELPRFPINEKYGDLDRFKFLLKLKPLEFKDISIKDMLISEINNPPKLNISFFRQQNNLDKINCFSNETGNWGEPQISLIDREFYINFREKFKSRRGRVNCSLNDNGEWRWLGLQFTFK